MAMVRLPLLLCMLTVAGGLTWQTLRGGRASARSEAEAHGSAAAPQGGPPASSPAVPVRARTLAEARSAALLSVDGPELFPALAKPGPSDWLANHREEGQSQAEFEEGIRRGVTATRRTVRLQPLDDVSKLGVDVALLAEHLRLYYGLPVVVAPPARPTELLSRTNRSTKNRQILTGDVLDWLEGEITSDLVCVLAITTEDLYPDDAWNFVFGMASLDQGVGVFSFARMDPSFPQPPPDPTTRTLTERLFVLRRCLKVVTHEVGHMFGLQHCILRSCLMNGSNHADEMDRTPLHVCSHCLRKIQHATGLDVAQRYEALATFYRREGLEPEARWVEAVLARVPR